MKKTYSLHDFILKSLFALTTGVILSGFGFIMSSNNVLAEDTAKSEVSTDPEPTEPKIYTIGETIYLPIYLGENQIGTYSFTPTQADIDSGRIMPPYSSIEESLIEDNNIKDNNVTFYIPDLSIVFKKMPNDEFEITMVNENPFTSLTATIRKATINVNIYTDSSKPITSTTVEYNDPYGNGGSIIGSNNIQSAITSNVENLPVGYDTVNIPAVNKPTSLDDLNQDLHLKKFNSPTWTLKTFVNNKAYETKSISVPIYEDLDTYKNPMTIPNGSKQTESDLQNSKIIMPDQSYSYSNIQKELNLPENLNLSDPYSFLQSLNRAYIDSLGASSTIGNINLLAEYVGDITVEQYYTVDKPTNNSGGNSSTPNNFKVTDQKQLISTFVNQGSAKLYTIKGDKITANDNLALSPGTDWASDQVATRGGATYYRVATNAWVKSGDVYQYVLQNSVVTTGDKISYLLHSNAAAVSNRALGANSSWKSDRIAYLSGYGTNNKFYRVATDEFVNADDLVK